MNQWLLQNIMGLWVGQEQLAWYQNLDWEEAVLRLQQPGLTYPDYYRLANFHGIREGYLTSVAALTYDPVTRIASPPSERWLRRQLLASVAGQPRMILDLGCGTGSSTLLLKQAFPDATVIGLDLSPYMLIRADYKAQQTGITIDWCHGMAESTPWASAHFDLVTASFLFHEMPPAISIKVLQESLRLVKPGGQILVLDGSQRMLRHLNWLIDLFREPYSRLYASGCMRTWLESVGFAEVKSRHLGLIHQVTTASRP